MSDLIRLPILIDSEISSSIITLNDDLISTKERIAKIELLIRNENNENEKFSLNCDYSNLSNIAYKLKSACIQIEDTVKAIANK